MTCVGFRIMFVVFDIFILGMIFVTYAMSVMSCQFMICYVRLKLSGPDLVRLCLGIDVCFTLILICYVVMLCYNYELSRKDEEVRPHLELLSFKLCHLIQ